MTQSNPKLNHLIGWVASGNASGQFRFGIAFRMIVSIATILLIFAGVLIAYSYQTSGQNIQAEAQHTLGSYYLSYQTKIESEQKNAEALAISVASRTDVQELFISGDRNGLFELLSPMFEQWKEREIVHLYIENPDGTVFLRVHNREQFGDDITYRGTAQNALQEQRTTSGVEIGPNRLGVRAVTPMYGPSGEFIGLVEVGMDFDERFIADLKQKTGADYTLWVSYDSAAIPNLKPAAGVPDAPIQDLFYYAGTNPSLPLADAGIYETVLKTGQAQYVIIDKNTSEPTIIYATRLLGYNDKLFGVLQISESYAHNLEAQNRTLLSTFGVVGGLTAASLFLIWLLTSRLVLRPVAVLTQFAQKQASGETNARVSLYSADEFEQLANTFNSLTDTVEHDRQVLEQRVAVRTKDLATVAEVGTATATILESKRLLQEVVNLTKERFNLYHSHIYLLDEKGENLVLTAGAGEPGRIMTAEGRSIRLSQEQSLVARAARERRGVTVNDVTQAPDFLPNPLLPDTRSELAVPMIVGGNVVGVFDIQSEQVGRFTESDVDIQTTLAAQLAVSIQNVRSFEQSKKQAELQSLVNMIGGRIQRTTSIEETLQTAIRELGAAIGASSVKATISAHTDGNN